MLPINRFICELAMKVENIEDQYRLNHYTQKNMSPFITEGESDIIVDEVKNILNDEDNFEKIEIVKIPA